MKVRVESEEIEAAVAAAVEAKIPGSKVERIMWTRIRGGGVYADVTVKLDDGEWTKKE